MALWHKYPYTDIHDLNLDWILKVVKEMKEKFDSIDFDYIFNTLTELNNVTAQHTTQIAGLQSSINSIGQQLLDLAHDIEEQGDDIEDLQGRVDGIGTQITQITNNITTMQGDIRDMKDDIAELQQGSSGTQGEIDGIKDDVDALDTRVTGLEQATYGTVTANPSNIFYSADMRNLDGVDYEITKISGDFDVDDIYIDSNTHMLTFYHNETSNTCKLVLKNILTDIDEYIDIDNVIINLGFLLDRQGGYHYTSFSNGLTISQLLNGYSGNDYFKTIKMVRNSNGDFDLEIQQYPQSFYLRITLKHMFVSLGQTPMTQALVKDFIGNPTQNLVGIIKKNAPNYDSQIAALNASVTALDNNKVGNSTFNDTVSTLTNAVNGAINVANTALHNSEYDIWDQIEDIFTDLPQGIEVEYFSLVKQGATVTLSTMIKNIPFSSNFSDIKFGTFRPAVRDKIFPKANTLFANQIAFEAEHIGDYWEGQGHKLGPREYTNNCKLLNVFVTGEYTFNPYQPGISASELDTYSMYLDVNDFSDTRCNSAIINITWVTI